MRDYAPNSKGLWLPSSERPAPAPEDAPTLVFPETFGQPRSEATHAHFRSLIAEGQALVDAARLRRREAADAFLARLEAGTPKSVQGALVGAVRPRLSEATAPGANLLDEAPRPGPALVGDPNPGIGAGQTVHREADGFEVNAPGTERAAHVTDPEVVQRGLMAEVPHRKQIGGTCGLYALGMVMDFWHQRDPKHGTALVQADDRQPPEGNYVHFVHEPTDDRLILDEAKAFGFTAKGEMYEARFVAETARRMGYQASLRTQATLEDLYAVLDAGHPAIVPFNVDRDGEAGTPDSGRRAHYAVVQGYFDHEGERYVVAKHSWSKTHDRVWRADDFLASWSNLLTTKFYGTPGDGEIPDRPDLIEPSELSLPDAGDGRADISQALARTIVEVTPKGEALTGGDATPLVPRPAA